jgi:hypothetical protein
MKPCFALILLTIFFFRVTAQPKNTVLLADSLLKPGSFKAAMVTYEFPPAVKELQEKALKNLKNDPQWADKYIVVKVEKGASDLSYMEAYGLTQQEFVQMLDGFKRKKQAILKDTFDLEVRKRDGLITFRGSGKLSYYNYFIIDKKNSQIIYDNNNLAREVELRGKFYAPILFGYGAFWDEAIPGKKQMVKGSSGFSIGKNQNDDRTTLCLLLDYGGKEPKGIIITILK